MLGYKFPVINHIDDVLPAIEGNESFDVLEKDGGYTSINYRMLGNDVFELMEGYDPHSFHNSRELIKRECRGLIFDTDFGVIIGRRFHKFFNLGEREDLYGSMCMMQGAHALEKLDGSMVSPVKLAGGWRWMTKAGITTVSMQAETFVADKPEYHDFAEAMLERGCNPIFEWCSRENRIVIDHEEDRLVLLAVRNLVSGAYVHYSVLRSLATEFGVELVQAYAARAWHAPDQIEAYIQQIRGWEGHEGVVFRDRDGHSLKVKAEQYTMLHKLKESTDREHVLVRIILDEGLDDVLSLVDEDAQSRVRDYATTFWNRFEGTVEHTLFNVVNRFSHLDRKKFAQSIADYDPLHKSLAFRAFGLANDDAKREAMRESLRRTIDKRTSNATNWQVLREQLRLPEYVRPF